MTRGLYREPSEVDGISDDLPHRQSQLFKLKKMYYKTSLAERKLINLLPDFFLF